MLVSISSLEAELIIMFTSFIMTCMEPTGECLVTTDIVQSTTAI